MMGGIYFQRCGAAMGVKFSPSLANLYMGWWERSSIFGLENLFRPFIKLYFRYIDDLLIGMEDGQVAHLDSLLVFLNSNNKNLSFMGQGIGF